MRQSQNERSFSPKTARARCQCAFRQRARRSHWETQTKIRVLFFGNTNMKTSTKQPIKVQRAGSEQAALSADYRNTVDGGTTDEVHGSIEQDFGGRHGNDHQHTSASLKDHVIKFAGRIALAYTEAAVVEAARWTQRAKPELKRRAPRVVRLIALRDAIQRRIDNELQMKNYCRPGNAIILYEEDRGIHK